jgi:hypothetical protein
MLITKGNGMNWGCRQEQVQVLLLLLLGDTRCAARAAHVACA